MTYFPSIAAWTPALVMLFAVTAVEFISRVCGWKFFTTVVFCFVSGLLVIGTMVTFVMMLLTKNTGFHGVLSITTQFVLFVGALAAAFHLMRQRPLWLASIVALVVTLVAFPLVLRAVAFVTCKTGGGCV